MPHYTSFSVRDYSEETSTFRLNVGALTALSLPGFLTAFGNLKTGVTNIILGVLGKEKIVMDDTVLSNAAPADSAAQVELKFLFSYEGDTSKKKFQFEVPTPDTSKIIAGSDMVDVADVDVAAFITAVEAIGRSPDSDVETITVLDARLVGRNR